MKIKVPEKLKNALKSKYLLPILIAVCALLLLLPQSGDESTDSAQEVRDSGFSVESEEERLEDTLSRISGVGKVRVLLSQEDSGESVYAESGDEVLVVSAGSGTQQPVERYTRAVQYRGAVIVCQGADSAQVRLSITQAVMAYTGLSSDKISVFSMD